MKEVLKVCEINGKPFTVLVSEANEPNCEKIARSVLRLTQKMRCPVNDEGTA
ncbi:MULTISPECIES: hypothetical protein [Bacillus]|uniref:hypothetical protein n=1 Tax=Bacillus TaxID=1386 RepID=UPI00166F957C|nr:MULTISPECIES: hypothetical protein [Bacillus]MCY7682725.1 hypothetical protein [Bacillus velezensis]MEC2311324.1 hypothetical protein [Bacillus velezensis]UGW82789.1 hypothetical protein LT232_10505 [Bacillus velezensis]